MDEMSEVSTREGCLSNSLLPLHSKYEETRHHPSAVHRSVGIIFFDFLYAPQK